MDSISFLTLLQQYLVALDAPLRWLSLHTYSSFYLLIAITIYWGGLAVVGVRLGCGVLFSTLIFGGCRQFFASPRPYWDHPHLFQGLYEKAWGMPSGHTQNAFVFWGLSAFSVKARWFTALCLLTATAIAVSRMYLGLHYPAQILAGFTLGITLLLIWTTLEARALNQLKSYPLPVQMTLAFLLAGLPLVITVILREVASLGVGNGDPLAYKRLLFYSGLLQGAGLSLLVAFTRTCKHITGTSFSFRLFLTRALPGVLSVWLIWKIKYIQPDFIQDKTILYIWFWLEGILLSFWACLLWPALHNKVFETKIMQK